MTTKKQYASDLAYHPGELIAEELEARGMSQRELARQLGRRYQVVNELVHGRKSVTADTALDLERVWSVSAELWLGLQQAYDLSVARQRRAEPA